MLCDESLHVLQLFANSKLNDIVLHIDSGKYSKIFPTTIDIQDDFSTQVCNETSSKIKKIHVEVLITTEEKINITIAMLLLQEGYSGLLLDDLTNQESTSTFIG
jgi:Arc/MetJ family transcription regulator